METIYVLIYHSGDDYDDYVDVEPIGFKTMEEAHEDLWDRGYTRTELNPNYTIDSTHPEYEEGTYFDESYYTIKEIKIFEMVKNLNIKEEK